MTWLKLGPFQWPGSRRPVVTRLDFRVRLRELEQPSDCTVVLGHAKRRASVFGFLLPRLCDAGLQEICMVAPDRSGDRDREFRIPRRVASSITQAMDGGLFDGVQVLTLKHDFMT